MVCTKGHFSTCLIGVVCGEVRVIGAPASGANLRVGGIVWKKVTAAGTCTLAFVFTTAQDRSHCFGFIPTLLHLNCFEGESCHLRVCSFYSAIVTSTWFCVKHQQCLDLPCFYFWHIGGHSWCFIFFLPFYEGFIYHRFLKITKWLFLNLKIRLEGAVIDLISNLKCA